MRFYVYILSDFTMTRKQENVCWFSTPTLSLLPSFCAKLWKVREWYRQDRETSEHDNAEERMKMQITKDFPRISLCLKPKLTSDLPSQNWENSVIKCNFRLRISNELFHLKCRENWLTSFNSPTDDLSTVDIPKSLI